jgi:hypothetical protein
VFPVKYELGFYIPEDDILRGHFRENLKSFTLQVYLCSRTSREMVLCFVAVGFHYDVSGLW